MNKKFVDRTKELAFLDREYEKDSSSLVIIYGRRRVGKTALIKHFIQDKPALYFLASEETERENLDGFRQRMHEFTGSDLLEREFPFTWDDLFQAFKDYRTKEKKIAIIDEFQYLARANAAVSSIFQRVWDNLLQEENVMLILCGSLIHMMESQTLSYSSPLYGRRTGQIKLKQIHFPDYEDFFPSKNKKRLIEYYAVTGGVPKYIEIFSAEQDIFSAIEKNILNRQSFLYEEPIFLLEREVGEIGSYFSIIKTIARGNHKLSKMASVLNVSQSNLTRYLKILIDLDLIERIVPVTESDSSKSKRGLYYLTDNFIEFWFKFIYPHRSYLEMEDTAYVMDKIRKNFIDNHVSFVFETVSRQKMWQLNSQDKLPFKLQRLGKWWDKDTEIDVVGLNEDDRAIIFGECKYLERAVDIDVFYQLVEKAKAVAWHKNRRREYYILFSKSGFTRRLTETTAARQDLQLFDASAGSG